MDAWNALMASQWWWVPTVPILVWVPIATRMIMREHAKDGEQS